MAITTVRVPDAQKGPHRPVRPLLRRPGFGRVAYPPALLDRAALGVELAVTWPPRKLTAAITARAISATRRMYSTMLAPRSVP